MMAVRRSRAYLRALHAMGCRCRHARDAAAAADALAEGQDLLARMARVDTALVAFGLSIVALLLWVRP